MKYLYRKIKSMRQLFKIDESEKKRILEMHENATKKNYLSEQPTPAPATTQAPQQRQPFVSLDGVKYNLPAIKSDEDLNTFTAQEFYNGYGKFNKVPGYTEDLRVHAGFYVDALLHLIAQKVNDNQSICDASFGTLIDDKMMSDAYMKYKSRASELKESPLDATRFYKIASGFFGSNVNITSDDMVIRGKDNLKKGTILLAQANIKKLPNACTA
jgi:hypothetical protein